jgi:hypothetical protein
MNEIEDLRRKKPRDFWKHFRTKTKNKSGNIPLDAFRDFFKNLGGNVFNCENDESEFFNEHNNFDLPNNAYPELARPISVEEIVKAVKLLKRNKAHVLYNLLNEYFIKPIDILALPLSDMFNKIIDSGVFPEAWTVGIIVPLHKKGSESDVNNYRGITLVSCLSKLFTSVINKRVENVCNE